MQSFVGFRSIGEVTDGRKLAFEKQGNETVIVSTVGKGHQIYSGGKLRLLFLGTSGQNQKASHVVALSGRVYIAEGGSVSVWKRGKLVERWEEVQRDRISHMMAFGEGLLTVSRRGVMAVHDACSQGAVLSTVALPNVEQDAVSAVAHPHTYLNKVVVGTSDGRLQLWNLKSGQLVHSFAKASWRHAVVCIEQSPAVDVVGVALANGDVHLVNLKYDSVLFSFRLAHARPTALSFRTDGPPILAVSSEDGQVAFFDLTAKALVSMLRAHRQAVSTLYFFPNEPILVSSSGDNSIKMWIFDRQDGLGCRLLRHRAGHSQPPTFVRYYGASSESLLCAGRDSALRLFSTIQDHQNVEFSQGVSTKQLKKDKSQVWVFDGTAASAVPPIRRFAHSAVREREWDNVVTCHIGDPYVYTWRYENKVVGAHRVCSTEPRPSCPLAVAISACGHFFVLATEGGWIDRFNIQSGLHRGAYAQAKGRPAHGRPVTGLVCDPLNRFLISASLDATVCVWSFEKRSLLRTIPVDSPVTTMEHFATPGGLLAVVACDDFGIRVVDIESCRIVRHFRGHTAPITDLAFSADGRWIVSTSMDRTLVVWDLPTSSKIDWALFPRAATSVALSPTGDFLVTSHVDSNGLCLWSNRNHFATVFFQAPSSQPPLLLMNPPLPSAAKAPPPSVSTALADGSEGSSPAPDPKRAKQRQASAVEPLAPALITLSGLVSESHWKHLAELDVIKARNKPKEAPKAPEAAPFFLPTKSGLETTFLLPPEDEAGDGSQSRIRSIGSLHFESGLIKLIKQAFSSSSSAPRDVSPIIQYLAERGPSQVDLEFRSLGLLDDQTLALMLDFFTEVLLCQDHFFELGQSYLGLFLHLYSEDLLMHPILRSQLESLQASQRISWSRLEGLFQSTLCLVEYFSGLV